MTDPGPGAELRIRNLVGRYCEAVARFDVELFASCWTDDASWGLGGQPPTLGREAIIALFDRARRPFELCIQEILSGVVDGPALGEGSHGGLRSARWIVRELQWKADRAPSCLIGIYTDGVHVEGTGARFHDRRFTALYRGPVDLTGTVTPLPGPVPR